MSEHVIGDAVRSSCFVGKTPQKLLKKRGVNRLPGERLLLGKLPQLCQSPDVGLGGEGMPNVSPLLLPS